MGAAASTTPPRPAPGLSCFQVPEWGSGGALVSVMEPWRLQVARGREGSQDAFRGGSGTLGPPGVGTGRGPGHASAGVPPRHRRGHREKQLSGLWFCR